MRRRDPTDFAFDLLEATIENATEGLAPEAVREIAKGFREQPRREVRARIRVGRLGARLERIRARDPSAFRRARERLIEAKIDNAQAVLDALEEMERS